MALNAHIEKQTTGQPAVAADEAAYLAGADVYKQHCASCHGLPGQAPTDYSTTMYPEPPQLFRGKGVTDDPASESYWKTANGIRLTGMPAFKTKLSGHADVAGQPITRARQRNFRTREKSTGPRRDALDASPCIAPDNDAEVDQVRRRI